jgi:hypothetical protein
MLLDRRVNITRPQHELMGTGAPPSKRDVTMKYLLVDEIFMALPRGRPLSNCFPDDPALSTGWGNYFYAGLPRNVAFLSRLFVALAARLKAEPTRLVICEQPRVFGSSSK